MGTRSARPYIIVAAALAFGPLAIGLIAHALNVSGLASEEGTWNLFRRAPIVALFACPAAFVVLAVGVFPNAVRALTAAALVLLIGPGSCVAYYGYWSRQWSHAEAQATRFCESAVPGSDISNAVARARAMDRRMSDGTRDGEAYYVVTFPGPIFNAFNCEIRAADGKVISARVAEPVN